jgi:hypothetical protein
MDPYIERPAIWRDFHDRFITYLCEGLRPILKPKYAPLTQDRLYVVEADRPVYPDVAIVRTPAISTVTTAVAVLEPDTPSVFELWREEIREPLIHIVEPAANNRVVTTVEVLSPTNKTAGEGRKEYLLKRDEMWRGGVNLVEIDLLRAGDPTVRLSQERMKELKPWNYLVAVTRRWPPLQQVYEVVLRRHLPKIAIPLSSDDKDVVLDLQAVFNRTWDEGPYPELLHYGGPPPGNLASNEVTWCEECLRAAGYRAVTPG